MGLWLLLALIQGQDVFRDESNGITLRSPGSGWRRAHSMSDRPALVTWARPSDGASLDVRMIRPIRGSSFRRDTETLRASIEEPEDFADGRPNSAMYWMTYTLAGPGGRYRTKVVYLDAGERWFAFSLIVDAAKYVPELEGIFDQWVASAEVKTSSAEAVTTTGWIIAGIGVALSIGVMIWVRRRATA